MINYATQIFIKDLRIKANLTIQDVSDILGVSKPAVSKWENGDGSIKTEMLYRISKLYGVTVEELLNGKMNNESNYDFWKRNYDLNNYLFNTKKEDYDVDAKVFYEHCNMIKERFYELLVKWPYDRLKNDDFEEFKFIKDYFEFDIGYYAYIKHGPGHLAYSTEKDEKDFLKKLLDENKDLKGDDLRWLLMKVYNFSCEIYAKEVFESGNIKAIEYLLSTFSQIQKDHLLLNNLTYEYEEKQTIGFDNFKQKKSRPLTIDEIESNEYVKIFLNSGANCLLDYSSFNSFNGWDREELNHIDGKVIEIKEFENIQNDYRWYHPAGDSRNFMLKNWKLYTYQDYLKVVDIKKTNRLKDIVNLRNDNPLLYYKKLKEKYLGV
jgi:transcriptional regulator with XRE-family HTH domain